MWICFFSSLSKGVIKNLKKRYKLELIPLFLFAFGKSFFSPLSFLCLLSCPVRNALVVVAASCVALSWDAYGHHIFTITGNIAKGLPPFRPPPTTDTTGNGTVVSFGEIVKVSSTAREKPKLQGAFCKAFSSDFSTRF